MLFSGRKKLSRKAGGLGLGLTIAKENIRLLGGNLDFLSEEGKGSTFFVEIPYKPVLDITVLKEKIIKSSGRENAGEKYTILIAEDEIINYMYLDAAIKVP